MPWELLVTAVAFSFIGFVIGRGSGKKRSRAPHLEQRAAAYKQLFAAFAESDRALMDASAAELVGGQPPKEAKELVWRSRASLGALVASTRFLFPQSVVEALEQLSERTLETSLDEELDQLRRVHNAVYALARSEFGEGR